MQYTPAKEVQEKQIGYIHTPCQRAIKQDKESGNRNDTNHHHPHPHPRAQQLMMKMILIRQERVLVLTQAMQDHTDHVQQRNQHRRESDHHVRVGQCRRDLVRHAHVDDQETDHVAQRKAAGIPHEKLMSTVGVTEHVVAPKGHKDTQRTDRQQGVNILPTKKEYHAQDRQGDTTQARGQAINTVDQVDGVGDIHHDEHRERHPHPSRHRVNTEQATKRVEPVAG